MKKTMLKNIVTMCTIGVIITVAAVASPPVDRSRCAVEDLPTSIKTPTLPSLDKAHTLAQARLKRATIMDASLQENTLYVTATLREEIQELADKLKVLIREKDPQIESHFQAIREGKSLLGRLTQLNQDVAEWEPKERCSDNFDDKDPQELVALREAEMDSFKGFVERGDLFSCRKKLLQTNSNEARQLYPDNELHRAEIAELSMVLELNRLYRLEAFMTIIRIEHHMLTRQSQEFQATTTALTVFFESIATQEDPMGTIEEWLSEKWLEYMENYEDDQSSTSSDLSVT